MTWNVSWYTNAAARVCSRLHYWFYNDVFIAIFLTFLVQILQQDILKYFAAPQRKTKLKIPLKNKNLAVKPHCTIENLNTNVSYAYQYRWPAAFCATNCRPCCLYGVNFKLSRKYGQEHLLFVCIWLPENHFLGFRWIARAEKNITSTDQLLRQSLKYYL